MRFSNDYQSKNKMDPYYLDNGFYSDDIYGLDRSNYCLGTLNRWNNASRWNFASYKVEYYLKELDFNIAKYNEELQQIYFHERTLSSSELIKLEQ